MAAVALMHVGVCSIKVRFPENLSLKSKRQILKSLISRVSNRFNVSVAEVDDQNLWQVTTIGVACVSADKRYVNEVLSKVVDFITESRFAVEILDYQLEILPIS